MQLCLPVWVASFFLDSLFHQHRKKEAEPPEVQLVEKSFVLASKQSLQLFITMFSTAFAQASVVELIIFIGISSMINICTRPKKFGAF